MKFLCGSCRTKYQISDEKVRGKILTIRCKKCGAKIMVRESLARDGGASTAVAPVAEEQVEVRQRAVSSQPSGAGLAHAYDQAMKGRSGEVDDMPTSIAPVPANLDMAGVEWYVAIDGEQQGPFAFAEIVRKVGEGQIIGRHYVWHDGMGGWDRVRDVKDLASYLPTAKKRPPPPPPGDGAAPEGKVVDFAEKRAQRQRQQSLGASAMSAMDSDLEHTEVESADVGALVGTATTSDRAEQLDDVLNEALGIEGEGKTAQAAPEKAAPEKAVAVSGVAQAGANVSIDDMLSFDNNSEDIFANVPRASDEPEDLHRESTRFFVAAAGVNRQKSRNRMALLLGLVMVLGLAAFMGAWAKGIIEIRLPGIGNPFHREEAPVDEFADLDTSDVEDAEALKKSLQGVKDPAQRRAIVQRSKKRAPTKKAPVAGLDGLPTDYVADDEISAGGGAAGPRGDGPAALNYDPAIGTDGAARKVSVGDSPLPNSGIDDVVPVDRKSLDQASITAVINARKKSVSICYEQSLRGREDLRGKLEFKVTVQPSGEVGRVTIETTAFKGSKLGSCIADKIKDWRFPRFEGEPQQVVVPFVLEKHSY